MSVIALVASCHDHYLYLGVSAHLISKPPRLSLVDLGAMPYFKPVISEACKKTKASVRKSSTSAAFEPADRQSVTRNVSSEAKHL